MTVQFGTDGIRGRASDEITNDLAYRLGRAVASVFTADVFVGYDTRESSPMLARAVLAGLRDGGAHGINLGYFTTPGSRSSPNSAVAWASSCRPRTTRTTTTA